jgi:F-type H+-transporting ATPase subunit a
VRYDFANATDVLLATEKQADFSIHYWAEFELFGETLYLTTTHISLIILSVVLLVFALIARSKIVKCEANETPGKLQVICEILVTTVDNMVRGIMGDNGPKFRNWIGTVFVFALVCNLSGLFGLRPPTADYGVTLAIGLITFFIIHYNGVRKNGGAHFTNLTKPYFILFPINLIGEIAVPLSLSLRLFGNVLSGTVMMGLIYGLLSPPITTGIPAVLHVYFDIFSGCIQAYVFCMLTIVYINDKIAD